MKEPCQNSELVDFKQCCDKKQNVEYLSTFD